MCHCEKPEATKQSLMNCHPHLDEPTAFFGGHGNDNIAKIASLAKASSQ